MADIEYVDANCFLGSWPHPVPRALDSATAMRDAAAELGITRRLVAYAPAREWSPEIGNDDLGPQLGPGETGCWIADPLDFLDRVAIPRRLDDLERLGFGAVRLSPDPAVHNYRLDAQSLRPLIDELTRRGWPLLIETGLPQWDAIEDILRSGSIQVILCGLGYRHARSLYPVLARHSNLAVETSSFLAFGAIEDVVQRFGPGSLVFGTNAPILAMGAAVARLELAELSDEDRGAIAAGNLVRMLAGKVA